jgi:hypothetical protein
MRHFPQAGLTVTGRSTYYGVVNTSKGGVCRIFDRQREKIAYEDAGYLVRAGRRRYTSNLNGLSSVAKSNVANEVVSEGQFGEVRQELPTPGKWIVLRLLNLTLFRSLTLGAWLRRKILDRLILRRRSGPLQFKRSITFGEAQVNFRDQIMLTSPTVIDAVDLCRSFTSIHMGSAKYFHPSDLESTPLPIATGEMTDELNRNHNAHSQFTLRFQVPIAQEATVSQPSFMAQEEVLT